MGRLKSGKLPTDEKRTGSCSDIVNSVTKDVVELVEDKTELIKKDHLKAALLKIDNQDIVRKKAVLTASAVSFIVFCAFAILQSNIIPFSNKNHITLYANIFDYLALFIALTFLVASLYNVLYLEKRGENK